MSQAIETGLKAPKPLADPCRHLEDENIPQDQLEARLNGTESAWVAAKGQGTPETGQPGETSSKTKTSEPKAEQETKSSESKAETENPPDTKPEETKEETPEKAEIPSAEIPTKEETPLSENPEKKTAEPRNGTETSPKEERAETTSTETTSTETTNMKTTNMEYTTPETGTTPQGQERKPSKPSEGSESSPNTSESKDPNTSSRTNTSTGNVPRPTTEFHSRTAEKRQEFENTLLKDSLTSLKEECNDLVREQTAKVETLRKEITEESTRLECDMRELRQCLVATMQTYNECLSLKTNGIHSRIEESLDKLEMNSNCLCEGARKLIEEDRTVIHRIPAIVEEELTRAANETSNYVEGALKETVEKYTNEIKVSTKFLKKQVEKRMKASRFEKVTDLLMRVCCPILAAGTFVLACVVTCFV